MKKQTKHVLIGTGIAAAAVTSAVMISRSITKQLVHIAIDREQPPVYSKARAKLSGPRERTDLFRIAQENAEMLKMRPLETVETVSSYDKEILTGHLWRCDNAKRLIVAMHGWRSSWDYDFGTIADFWHDNGCSILFAEQRGQGKSGGDYMGFGMLERFDCRDWVNYANENGFADTPIYLAGVSMGATTVLMAAGLPMPENVHGVMADCGFTSPDAIWKYVIENNLHLPYDLHGAAANDLCRRMIHIGAKDYSTVDALQETKLPVLLVHGTDDHFVPITMTYENYKACVSPKRLFVVPGAEHGTSYLMEKDGYERAVTDFWKDFD